MLLLNLLVVAQIYLYPPSDARTRRALRESCVARVGEDARHLVEAYGEAAVAALQNCTLPIARRLARFEDLDKLPRPRDFLVMIAQPGNGDEACIWAMDNYEELVEVDAFNAYLAAPLEYALNLRALEDGVARIRARRQAVHAKQEADRRNTLLVSSGLVLAVVVIYLIKKQRSG